MSDNLIKIVIVIDLTSLTLSLDRVSNNFSSFMTKYQKLEFDLVFEFEYFLKDEEGEIELRLKIINKMN